MNLASTRKTRSQVMRVRPTARNGERFTPPSMTFCLLTCSLILTFLAAFCYLSLGRCTCRQLTTKRNCERSHIHLWVNTDCRCCFPAKGMYRIMVLSLHAQLVLFGSNHHATHVIHLHTPNHKSDKTSQHFNGGRGTPLQTLRTPRKFQKCLLTVFCSHQRAPFFPPPPPITVADNGWLQTSRRTIFPQRTSLTLLPTLHNLTELQFTCLCAMDT